MKSRSVLVMATLCVAIFCGWYILQRWNSVQETSEPDRPSSEIPGQSQVPASQDSITATSEVNSQKPMASAQESPAKVAPATFAEKIKNSKMIDNKEYLEQVEANPHGTPPALISSALQLGQLFDAVGSEVEAGQFMSHLKNCINADTPASFKTTCYKYADQISKKYTSLRKDFEGIRLDEDTQRILDMRKQGF